jgi:hypothetical protein
MASRLRLATRQSGLHEATLVGAAGLAGILIAEMNFDPGDLIAEPAESVVDLDLDSVRQFVTALNVVIRVDLDLHLRSPDESQIFPTSIDCQ